MNNLKAITFIWHQKREIESKEVVLVKENHLFLTNPISNHIFKKNKQSIKKIGRNVIRCFLNGR